MGKNDNAKLQVILLWVIWIVGLVWILAEGSHKSDKFVNHWLKQWLTLAIVAAIFWVVGIILTIVTLGLFGIVMMIVWVLLLVIWLIGLVNIIKGNTNNLPIVGKWGESLFKF